VKRGEHLEYGECERAASLGEGGQKLKRFGRIATKTTVQTFVYVGGKNGLKQLRVSVQATTIDEIFGRKCLGALMSCLSHALL
jgi:hypothetical protein